MREDGNWLARAGETTPSEVIFEKLDQLERGFDDIEHRITNIDREHSRYVKATVTRLGYLLNQEDDMKGLVIQLLNKLSANRGDEAMIQAVGNRMNLPRPVCYQKKLFTNAAVQERILQSSCQMKRHCQSFLKKRY